MPLILKYQGRQLERNDGGYTTTLVWTGTQDECETFASSVEPGSHDGNGTLDSVRIYQDAGNIWNVERRYKQDRDGNFTTKPNVVYGQKSAQLHGSMLSMPLETHKNYLARWNHYLVGAPGTTAVPSWWENAKDTVLDHTQSQKYAWIRSMGETPVDKQGRWHVIKMPKFPGVNSYDVATYSITETVKFSSASKAGTVVSGKLNQIGKPEEDFGLTGSGFNWKCDDATVSYNGGDWFATLTWTRSGDNKGWNPELYGGLS